jgi:hypothetical protein
MGVLPDIRPEVWMERLTVAEQIDRQLKSLRYQLKAARFPAHRDLMDFGWAETPLPQTMIEQLISASFMDTAHNIILVAGWNRYRGKIISPKLLE